MKDDFLNPEHRARRKQRQSETHKRRMADPDKRSRHIKMLAIQRNKIHALTIRKVFAQYHRAQWAQLRKDFEDIQRQYLKVA